MLWLQDGIIVNAFNQCLFCLLNQCFINVYIVGISVFNYVFTPVNPGIERIALLATLHLGEIMCLATGLKPLNLPGKETPAL